MLFVLLFSPKGKSMSVLFLQLLGFSKSKHCYVFKEKQERPRNWNKKVAILPCQFIHGSSF